jgi:hypothetical protein
MYASRDLLRLWREVRHAFADVAGVEKYSGSLPGYHLILHPTLGR